MSEHPRVRVATLNILGPANRDWQRRRRVISAALRRVDADVVALQEVPIASSPQIVDELLGSGYDARGFSSTAADGVGAAVATRWPHRLLEEIDQRVVSHRASEFPWCATLLIQLDSPVGPLLIAHHKPSWQFGYEAERERQALRAAQAVERHVADAHAVVLGDFDATPDSASVQFWKGRRSLDDTSVCYQDAWETVRPREPGFTFSAENPLVRAGEVATAVSRRIDYILVRSGIHGPSLQVDSCERLLDHPVDGTWASDHYGVIADLIVPDHRPGSWTESGA